MSILSESVNSARKLKTQLAQAQLRHEDIQAKYLTLKLDYDKLRQTKSVDVIDKFDRSQHSRLAQAQKEVTQLRSQLDQMSKEVIGDNNEKIWCIKEQLKMAVGDRAGA